MSGQLLLRTPDHPGDDRHARIRLHLDHPEHGELRASTSSTSAPSARWPSTGWCPPPTARCRILGRAARAEGRGIPRRWRTSPATRSTRRSTTGRSSTRSRAGRRRSSACCSTRASSAASATSTPTRRCGRCGCTASSPALIVSPRRSRELLAGRARGAREGARRGRHELRRPVRQRQRRVGLLRALAERLRAGRPALPALRHADGARVVHEPLVAPVPALPAAPDAASAPAAATSTPARTDGSPTPR